MATAHDPSGPRPVTGRRLAANERAVIDWEEESFRQTLPRLTDALQKLAAVEGALVGASLSLLKDDVMEPKGRLLVAGLFLAALALALGGMIPARRLAGGRAADVLAKAAASADRKWICLTVSAAFVLAGFVAAVGAAAYRIWPQ